MSRTFAPFMAELCRSRALAAQRVARLEFLEGTVPCKEIEAARVELQSLSERERSIGASVAARGSGVIARAQAVAGQVAVRGGDGRCAGPGRGQPCRGRRCCAIR